MSRSQSRARSHSEGIALYQPNTHSAARLQVQASRQRRASIEQQELRERSVSANRASVSYEHGGTLRWVPRVIRITQMRGLRGETKKSKGSQRGRAGKTQSWKERCKSTTPKGAIAALYRDDERDHRKGEHEGSLRI